MAGWSGGAKLTRVRWVYDRGGREIERVWRWVVQTTSAEVKTTTTYDAVGRPNMLKSENAGGAPTRVWYHFGSATGCPCITRWTIY
jgi:uncharacterized protein RhaS with RHS repeats